MKGLLQRARNKLSTADNKPDIQETDSIKAEIYSEIDQIVDKLHAETVAVSADFSVLKKDSVIPLVVIISSIIILTGGSLFFLTFYNSKEKTILTTRNRVLSTESKVLAAVKAESEEQLEIRDQRIQSIQTRLNIAVQDRNRLKEDAEQILNTREEELRKAMAETLEAERAKLAGQGLSSEDIQKKIEETSNRLEAENQSEMNDFKEQYEQELAEKELAMSIKIEEYQKNLEQSQSEQTLLQEQIAQRKKELRKDFDSQSTALENQKKLVLGQLEEIENVSARERLVSSQILESYKSIENKIEKSEYEDALAEIVNLENFLKQDSVLDLPVIERRLPAENFIITTLRDSISMKKTIKEDFPREKAELNTDIEDLEKRISTAAATIRSREEQIILAEREHQALNNFLVKVETLKEDDCSQEQILDLLATKVLLKQVLSTEAIKSQYPELLDQIELYFDIFGDNQKKEGRTAVLNEINKILESVAHTSEPKF